MFVRALFVAAALAFTGLSATTVTATAAEATATTAVNVRSGPATSYRVVDVLGRGDRVEVGRCTGGWCQISHRGADGWVSSNYLAVSDRSPSRPSRPSRGEPTPDVGFCIDAPNFSIGVNCDDNNNNNGRPDRGRPNRPDRDARVCFYEDVNFRGRSFCATPGESDRSLSRTWNDRISSISVRGNASATVCEDFNFRGSCARVTRDVRNIGSRNNDVISSYRVER